MPHRTFLHDQVPLRVSTLMLGSLELDPYLGVDGDAVEYRDAGLCIWPWRGSLRSQRKALTIVGQVINGDGPTFTYRITTASLVVSTLRVPMDSLETYPRFSPPGVGGAGGPGNYSRRVRMIQLEFRLSLCRPARLIAYVVRLRVDTRTLR